MPWRYQPPEDLSCRDVMDFLAGLADASVDLCATDPPYGLSFMGSDWDDPDRDVYKTHGAPHAAYGFTDGANRVVGVSYGSSRNPMCRGCHKHIRGKDKCTCEVPDHDTSDQRIVAFQSFSSWVERWAIEVRRVLRPGGYLLAMGGSRTFDALAWGIRMAGFEIRDSIAAPGRDVGVALWVYGSGMPHSKSELKSAFEFICVARKPFPRSLANNIAEHGTGGLDIEAGRIPATGKPPGWFKTGTVGSKAAEGFMGTSTFRMEERTPEEVAHVADAHERAGRWPPSYVLLHHAGCVKVDGEAAWRCHPECAVPKLDAQVGVLKSGRMRAGQQRKASKGRGFQGTTTFATRSVATPVDTIADAGGPSRFFVLPDPDAATVEHLPECALVGVRKLQGDSRGISVYECAPGCPVSAPLTEAAFDLPEGRDAAALEVGFYHKKVYPKDRELPGFQMIVPKDPEKPDKPGVDEPLARTLCDLWKIPVQAGQTALETLTGWPLPMEVWGADEPVLFQPAYSMHPTQKPLALASWLVRIFSPRSDKVGRPVVVVDPFGGSGTFVLAARQLGRVGLYNDFTSKYVAIAAARLEAAGALAPAARGEESLGLAGVGEVVAGAACSEGDPLSGDKRQGGGEFRGVPESNRGPALSGGVPELDSARFDGAVNVSAALGDEAPALVAPGVDPVDVHSEDHGNASVRRVFTLGPSLVGHLGSGLVPERGVAETSRQEHPSGSAATPELLALACGEQALVADRVESIVQGDVVHAVGPGHVVDYGLDRPHPASFPPRIIEVLREVVPRGLVLDPFGGIGKLGLLGPEWRVVSLEIEREWAAQGLGNGCSAVVVGDATRLPFRAGSLKCVVTSPSYGNRCADTWAPPDYGTEDARRSHGTRRTYRLALGRDLTGGSGAGLQWGDLYRELHTKALAEIHRVLAPGGTFVLNIKDHVRDKELQGVPAWWAATVLTCGFERVETREVTLKGDQNTARMRKQGLAVVDHEEVIVFRVPAPARLVPTLGQGAAAPVAARRVPFALTPKGGM